MVRLFVVLLAVQQFEVVSDCGGTTAPPVADPPGTQLAMGASHGCSIEAGALRCWGSNGRGELGRGTTSAFETRGAPVTLDEPVAQVVCGEQVTCVRTVSGRVFCFGDNTKHQLGRAELVSSATPLEVSIPVPIVKLGLHSDYVLAVGSDGRLFGWGNDFEGTLARGDAIPAGSDPVLRGVVRVAFGHLFKDVAAGQGHACGLDTRDVLWCWGRNVNQELGAGAPEKQLRSPVRVLENVDSVAAGAFGTCAIRAGALLCWGRTPIDDQGEEIVSPTPTPQSLGGGTARAVDLLWFHACALTTDDQLYCWGRGIEGQLGLGTTVPFATPQLVGGGFTHFATGNFATCGRQVSGAIVCTGANANGELGLGDTSRRATPTAQ